LIYFQSTFTLEFSKKFAIKRLSCFLPHLTLPYLTCYTTLRNLKNNFAIFPLQLLQKRTSKLIIFLVYVIRTIWHILPRHASDMLLTQHQLPFMCEICCEFFIFQQNNMSADWACTASVSVSPISAFWNGRHFHFIRPVAQHPDVNPVNYKIFSEMQQQVYLRKVCNMNGRTLWPC